MQYLGDKMDSLVRQMQAARKLQYANTYITTWGLSLARARCRPPIPLSHCSPRCPAAGAACLRCNRPELEGKAQDSTVQCSR